MYTSDFFTGRGCVFSKCDNILYTENGVCFYPISDAGANGRLVINNNTTWGLDKLNGTFWEKITFDKFVRDERLISDDNTFLYNRLNWFNYMKPLMVEESKQEAGRRVSRKKRSLKQRSHRW